MPIQTVPANMLGTTVASGPGTSVNVGVTIYEQTSTLATSYCITTGTNAYSIGPITVADNIVITVADGCVWTVV